MIINAIVIALKIDIIMYNAKLLLSLVLIVELSDGVSLESDSTELSS